MNRCTLGDVRADMASIRVDRVSSVYFRFRSSGGSRSRSTRLGPSARSNRIDAMGPGSRSIELDNFESIRFRESIEVNR